MNKINKILTGILSVVVITLGIIVFFIYLNKYRSNSSKNILVKDLQTTYAGTIEMKHAESTVTNSWFIQFKYLEKKGNFIRFKFQGKVVDLGKVIKGKGDINLKNNIITLKSYDESWKGTINKLTKEHIRIEGKNSKWTLINEYRGK